MFSSGNYRAGGENINTQNRTFVRYFLFFYFLIRYGKENYYFFLYFMGSGAENCYVAGAVFEQNGANVRGGLPILFGKL